MESVIARDGRQFAVMFSRQAGKDELLAQTVAYLLYQISTRGRVDRARGAHLHPQAALMRDRLYDRLRQRISVPRARLRQGYIVQYGRASARFLGLAASEPARADRQPDAGGE